MNRFNKEYSGFLALALIAGFGGCSHQDFGRPVHSPISDLLYQDKPYIESAEEQAAEERSRKFAKALSEWQTRNPETDSSYHIGVEDVVTIEIISLKEVGEPSSLVRTVDNNGMVNLSWAGNVKIAGLDIHEAEAAIIKHLSDGYIKNPSVTLKVTEYRSAGVVITGAVSSPGIYFLKSDRRSLLEVLALADGLDIKSGDELFLIRAKENADAPAAGDNISTNEMIVVDLQQLVDDANMKANIWVKRGDIISVQPRKKQYISVLGYVSRPGSFDIAGQGKVSALDALGLAGGLKPSARAENSWLLRQTPEGQKTVNIDITAMARGKRLPLYLEAGDTLIVGSSSIAKLSEFINPTIQAGASYSPVP